MSLGLAALIAWLFTASIGVYMLRTYVARGGLRRQRVTGEGVPPGVVFSHAGAALGGLTAWVCFVSSGWRPLAWVGVVLICAAICLGVCTVTLWTPYPVRPAPEPADEREAGTGVVQEAPALQARQAAAAGPQDAFTVTDEMIASLLAEASAPPQRPRVHLLPLIPLAHGLLAMTTFLLTVTAALLPVR